MSATVITAQDGPIRIIELNRPDRLNAINFAMVDELHAAISDAHADPSSRVIPLRGAGRAFCSGDDLVHSAESATETDPRQMQAHTEQLQDISRLLVLGDMPVVGAIHGWAVGAGFEWAINCDLTVWAEGARAFFPEIEWGLFPTGGIFALLPRMVGLARAREMLLLGEKYDASQLLKLGLATRVTAAENLETESLELARRLADFPSRAVTLLKRTLGQAPLADFESSLAAETAAIGELIFDPETIERIARFGTED